MSHHSHRIIYVGMHDGVCAVTSDDDGKNWRQGPVTTLPHAASRLTASPVNPERAYLAAYEAGVYRTDDAGVTWRHIDSYPTGYAHSVLAHPVEPDAVYAGSEPAAVFQSKDAGESWQECSGFRAVPESTAWGFHAPTRDSHVRDLRVSPVDPNHLYAGIEVGGMVRSRDGGSSWQQLPGLDDDIHCVNLSGTRPQRVYVATASAPYRTDDGGDRLGVDQRRSGPPLHPPRRRGPPTTRTSCWSRCRKTPGATTRNSTAPLTAARAGGWSRGLGSGENPEDMVVAFEWDPHSPGHVYAGTDGGKLYASNDRGETWQQLPVTLSSVAVGALAVA